ncbi:extracellular solute-binding protein, partial [bacterium]|nr:extracellular solute-binding protein [bacterium]
DVILASTTSTQDSGLFDVLIPAFEEAYPEYKVEVIAVGTGEALELGQNKDADVLLVHAKAKEEAFVADGFGTERKDVMYNDFVIVGPAADPAGIKGMAAAADAFKKIMDAGATFVSRGDDSGTHTKELSIWKAAGIEAPAGAWYMSAGQGMGDVLKIASETPGYTLADRATYLSLKDTLALELLVEGDKALFNQYGVIPVTDASNMEGAQAFADWIVSAEGQKVIEEYGVEEYGEALFIPNAQ